MDRIKRNERLAALTKLLTASPNQLFTLSHFCEMFGAAKSTLSEDIDILCDVYKHFGLGRLDTVTGAAGGVRYRPCMAHDQAVAFIEGVCQELQTPSRLLPGGFLYLSELYKRKTGKILKFIPIVIDDEYRILHEGDAVMIENYKKEREEAKIKIRDAIFSLPFSDTAEP